MDLSFLDNYVILVIVWICVCVGYVLKNSFPKLDNKYIPLVMAILGISLNIWIVRAISPDVILGGMFSGLSSTGLHQVFKNLINIKDGE